MGKTSRDMKYLNKFFKLSMYLSLKHVSYTIRITKGQSDSKRNVNCVNVALILDVKRTENTSMCKKL